LLIIAASVLTVGWAARANAAWMLEDEDWIFGEQLLPCQYRSPTDPACHTYRRCRKIGRRWRCSRWMNGHPLRAGMAGKHRHHHTGKGKRHR
jgi:hypothetical protein